MNRPTSIQPATSVDASIDLTQSERPTNLQLFGLRRNGGFQMPTNALLIGLTAVAALAALSVISNWFLVAAALALGGGGYLFWRHTFNVAQAVWISNDTIFSVTNFRTQATKVNQIITIKRSGFGRTVCIQFANDPGITVHARDRSWKQFSATLSRSYPRLRTGSLQPKKVPARNYYEYYETLISA